MKLFPQFYRLFNLLSLDIALGSVCMTYFVSLVLNVQSPAIFYFLLGQAVWLVYLLDHIYDSRKNNGESYRRIFYKKYAKLLLYVLLANIISITIFFILNFNAELIKWSYLPFLLLVFIY